MTSLDKTLNYVDAIRSDFQQGNFSECSSPAKIPSLKNKKVIGYPNPTTGIFHMDIEQVQVIEIFDSNGSLIQRISNHNNEQEINFQNTRMDYTVCSLA